MTTTRADTPITPDPIRADKPANLDLRDVSAEQSWNYEDREHLLDNTVKMFCQWFTTLMQNKPQTEGNGKWRDDLGALNPARISSEENSLARHRLAEIRKDECSKWQDVLLAWLAFESTAKADEKA